MKLYLAGPMRGYPELNFPAFDEAAAVLRELGHAVCNPADHDRMFYGSHYISAADDESASGFTIRELMAFDLNFVSTVADAVAVLPNWGASRGAIAEVATAWAIGIDVASWQAFDKDGIISGLVIAPTILKTPMP